MALGASMTATLREAQRVLETRASARLAPAVLWAGLDEPSEGFAERCAELRQRWAGRILVAVPYGYTVPADVSAVPFSPKMFALLHPQAPSRYRVASGGRGSGKSHAIAAAVVLRMLTRRLRILCAREIQRSLRESVHHLLSEKIDALGLSAFFDINDREITCTVTGSEIIFAGLMTNVQQLKSLEGVGLCWVEEAESVSARSLEILTPTIRAALSEIWLSLNPDSPDAPAQGFIEGARPDVRHVHVTYVDNPWFPAPLEGERAYLQSVDDDAYRHVWLGECRTRSDAQVFKGKYTVEEFDIGNGLGIDGPYLGADWGYVDPTTLIRSWIHQGVLYVDHEAYALGCDLDRMPELFDAVPGARNHVIRADNARPETISHLQRNGFPRLTACEKWSGSIEDGIAHLRSYERIVIHPRCVHTIEEMRLYSYKVDRLSGDVLPDLLDRFNHCIDALRYALEPVIRRPGVWHIAGIPRSR